MKRTKIAVDVMVSLNTCNVGSTLFMPCSPSSLICCVCAVACTNTVVCYL